ncbi:MAG: SET domain-containing protein-lysine N-methyltransferase [Thermodesulfobacteriota bacterium]
MNTKTYVGKSRFGKGVFAKERIRAGEDILFFDGEIITFRQAIEKSEFEGNPLQIGHDLYVDIKEPSVFLNHSCNPNAGIVKNRVLIAIKDIFPSDEICFDYSTTMMENRWTMACKCGFRDCRGIIKDFCCLPEYIKRHYLQSGIVQDFIAAGYQDMPIDNSRVGRAVPAAYKNK